MGEDFLIQSVMFRPDEAIEITYLEEREQTNRAGLVKTVVFERSLASAEIADVLDTLSDVIGKVWISIRTSDEDEVEVEVGD